MRIHLDRSKCTRWQGACEACFASHLVHGDFETADCALDVRQDGRANIEFAINDRDHSFKVLTITPVNRAEALDSWLLLWRQQAGAAA